MDRVLLINLDARKNMGEFIMYYLVIIKYANGDRKRKEVSTQRAAFRDYKRYKNATLKDDGYYLADIQKITLSKIESVYDKFVELEEYENKHKNDGN